MSDTGLKPCPFCGGAAAVERDPCLDGGGNFIAVRCRQCRAKSGEKYATHGNDCPQTYQEARDLWNDRQFPAPSQWWDIDAENLAKQLAYATRHQMDASEDAEDYWRHTGEATRAYWVNLACVAIKALTPPSQTGGE